MKSAGKISFRTTFAYSAIIFIPFLLGSDGCCLMPFIWTMIIGVPIMVTVQSIAAAEDKEKAFGTAMKVWGVILLIAAPIFMSCKISSASKLKKAQAVEQQKNEEEEKKRKVEEERKKAEEEAFKALPHIEHIAKAKEFIADARWSNAQKHIDVLDNSNPQKRILQNQMISAKNREAIAERRNFAKELEEFYLIRRMDTKVRATGNNLEVLRIEWILAGRVSANELAQSDVPQWARGKGFKRIIITDGYRESYTITL